MLFLLSTCHYLADRSDPSFTEASCISVIVLRKRDERHTQCPATNTVPAQLQAELAASM